MKHEPITPPPPGGRSGKRRARASRNWAAMRHELAHVLRSPEKPGIGDEFRTPALALESDEPPRAMWWLLYSLLLLLLIAFAWSVLASVDEIVGARGELVTVAPNLVVQPLERVVVKHVHVRAGDVVRKGQTLATLDPTFAEADVEQTRAKLAALTARQARLEAEIDRIGYTVPDNPNKAEALEESLFNERRLTYTAKMRSYDEDIARLDATLRATTADIDQLKARIDLTQKIVDMRQKLVAQAYDNKLRLYESQAQQVFAERELVQAYGKIEETTHQLDSVRAQREFYAQEWREKAADELVTVRRDRLSTAEDLSKAQRRRDMVSLTAPEDAMVLEIAQRSIGSVLREAEVLFTLVPLDAKLEIEARVSPLDIGRVHVGDVVRVKFDAFPFQRHGTGRGHITVVSPDAFRPARGDQQGSETPKPETQAQYHKVRVVLDDLRLRNTPPEFRLLPGMTVTAEIKIGERKVITYLLYPILKGLDESMHEP
ncbi:HlyD family type I secretion periplasmic adaptor subunit [Bradyrhizobium sp. SZCCHNRI3037]|uniref:HlyD family type I secretion periplasmic adaptor subunit n=1 Tax=Bradyrhizobium sp. SZCCHNRI3037 TaxID=3057290 RepID=UPI0029163906|nr:HlyD family type I secretion periplasmic adaptor subunit [Bradyrhizobium sp. SZCCHNRI3037]